MQGDQQQSERKENFHCLRVSRLSQFADVTLVLAQMARKKVRELLKYLYITHREPLLRMSVYRLITALEGLVVKESAACASTISDKRRTPLDYSTICQTRH